MSRITSISKIIYIFIIAVKALLGESKASLSLPAHGIQQNRMRSVCQDVEGGRSLAILETSADGANRLRLSACVGRVADSELPGPHN